MLLGPRCYFTSDPPLVELSPCSKDGQGEGEATDIAHQPISQGIEPGRQNIMQAANAPFRAMHSGGTLRHIWLKKRPASRKSVMPHSGRTLCRDVIPSAVRSGGPHRAYRTRALRMRHEIIFRSRTGLLRRAQSALNAGRLMVCSEARPYGTGAAACARI